MEESSPRLRIHADWPTCDVGFWCPGCGCTHWVPTAGERAWQWNGSMELPILSPSILRHGFHEELGHQIICHSFVRNGRIEYLGDCEHELAGTSVDLPLADEWPKEYWE